MSTAPTLHLYQGNDWDKLSDNTIQDDVVALYCKASNIDPEKLSASQELSERMEALAYCEAQRTRDKIYEASQEISEKYDFVYGIALPSISNEASFFPILADGTPMSHVNFRSGTELGQRLSVKNSVRNSWEVLGDKSVAIIETKEGPVAFWNYHAGNRHRRFMDGVQARMDSNLSAESELKAIDLLKTKVSPAQFRCYMLNGAFPEKSDRSDLHYFFRKGLPVMAVSWHGEPKGKILACLCLHPYGYFEFTHAGVMTPTDEVIAQLLLMRADEHKFWAKSGQWKASDPRSGL